MLKIDEFLQKVEASQLHVTSTGPISFGDYQSSCLCGWKSRAGGLFEVHEESMTHAREKFNGVTQEMSERKARR